MSEKASRGLHVLFFSVLAGISLSASYLAAFSDRVPFSLFPIISLLLSGYCLYLRYVSDVLPNGIGSAIVASFLLGLFGYITVILVEYSDMGSNMLPTLICLALLFWTVFQYGRIKAA